MLSLTPLSGTIRSYVFENEYLGIKPHVVYDIRIPLEPFEFENQIQDTRVVLSRIRFKVKDWRDLATRSFEFPINPKKGYVDGSVYLGDVHNPADLTFIRFGTINGNSVSAELRIQFDFTYEGPSALGMPSFTWTVQLTHEDSDENSER